MPDAETYIKRIKYYGTDQVLETACRDYDLTDDAYLKVWAAVFDATPKGGRRTGKSHLDRMRDRDYAKASL